MKKQFNWGLIIILLLAVFWRFWDFGNRWVLNQDQGRDATIALYAIRNNLTPEIGSPSSAGPFNFGPWYHFIIMSFERVLPTINGPWIGFGILSVLSVVLYYLTGGMAAGLLAASASGLVENSPDMLNTVIVGFSSAMMWWATKKLVETDNWKWGGLVGFMVGISINFHFQSWGLMAVPLLLVIVNRFELRKRLFWGMTMALGWLSAFLPIIIFDIKRNGVWIRSVIEYYTVGVKKFYVPVRWLTEISDFWPQLWGSVTTGSGSFGYVWVVLGLIMIVFLIKKRQKIDRFWWIVAGTFLIQILLMRNYKGVRSREYMIAFHGMIILMSSLIISEFFKWRKWAGTLILAAVLAISGYSNLVKIAKEPSQAKTILKIKNEIDNRVDGNIRFEQYQQSDMAAMPLFYLYYRENRIASKGTTVAICDGNRYDCPEGELIRENNYRIYIDKSFGWEKLTPENIYQRLMVNYDPVKAAIEGKYVTVVNPVRSRELWRDRSLKPIEDQYEAIERNNLKATWLIQDDVIGDKELTAAIKGFSDDQEIGVFLEVSKDLAYNARVYFDEQRPWYDPGVVFLSGYDIGDRKKIIDKMMSDFKNEFGYYPKSAGAWWIDSISQQYLENKYGIKTIMVVADQKTTDSYGVWGQWWGIPYHPAKDNILVPGNSRTTVIQWAQRDWEKAYNGEGKLTSNYSLQANDYTSLGLDIKYFEKLAGDYLSIKPVGQITVGLETGMESVGQEKEYEKQLKWISENKITSVTMSDFGKVFGSENPNKILMGNWVMTQEYRENKILGERTDYKNYLVFKDFFQKDTNSFLNRVYKAENLVDKSKIPNNSWMIFTAVILGAAAAIKLKGGRWILVGVVIFLLSLAAERARYTVVDGERMIGILWDNLRFVGVNLSRGLVNKDLSNLTARSMLKIGFEYGYLIRWAAVGLIIQKLWKTISDKEKLKGWLKIGRKE